MRHINSFTSVSATKPSWERTPDGFLRCRARVLAERVMPYARHELSDLPDDVGTDVVNMLVTRGSMSTADSIRSLEGVPIVIGDHQWLTPELVKEFGCGSVAGTPVLEGPYLVCDLLVTNPEAITAIESGSTPEISAAYTAETIFEAGDFDGQPYDAKQTQLRYNHIAVIPEGHGRAGTDVRILNKDKSKTEGENEMSVKVQLKNTGKFVNTDEEGAAAIAEESTKSAEVSEGGARKLEDTIGELETKNGELAALQSEVEELKGELSVYKEKLDELLSTEAIEHAAAGMIEESAEASEILENCSITNEKGEEVPEEKEKLMNSLKGVYGTPLHTAVLSAVGVKCENMSAEAIKGAFKAQHQIVTSTKKFANKKTVAGHKMAVANTRMEVEVKGTVTRTSHERLGFANKK